MAKLPDLTHCPKREHDSVSYDISGNSEKSGTLVPIKIADSRNGLRYRLWLAKTSYTCKMNDLAQSSIRTFPI